MIELFVIDSYKYFFPLRLFSPSLFAHGIRANTRSAINFGTAAQPGS